MSKISPQASSLESPRHTCHVPPRSPTCAGGRRERVTICRRGRRKWGFDFICRHRSREWGPGSICRLGSRKQGTDRSRSREADGRCSRGTGGGSRRGRSDAAASRFSENFPARSAVITMPGCDRRGVHVGNIVAFIVISRISNGCRRLRHTLPRPRPEKRAWSGSEATRNCTSCRRFGTPARNLARGPKPLDSQRHKHASKPTVLCTNNK